MRARVFLLCSAVMLTLSLGRASAAEPKAPPFLANGSIQGRAVSKKVLPCKERKKMTPKLARAVFKLAVTRYKNFKRARKRGDEKKALESLSRIVKLDPFPTGERHNEFLAFVYVTLVHTLFKAGRLKEAWEQASRGMVRTARDYEKHPTLAAAELLKLKGRIKAAQGDSKTAMQLFQRAINLLERRRRKPRPMRSPEVGSSKKRP